MFAYWRKLPMPKEARQAAVELFSIRHVCGFGPDLPDGVVPLDGVFGSGFSRYSGSLCPAEPCRRLHVAAITFGLEPRGIMPIARNHMELVAGGLGLYLAADVAADTPQLSTIPIGSFAGVSSIPTALATVRRRAAFASWL